MIEKRRGEPRLFCEVGASRDCLYVGGVWAFAHRLPIGNNLAQNCVLLLRGYYARASAPAP